MQVFTLYQESSGSPLSDMQRAYNFVRIQHAAALLGQGELVAFPTETVYGLGANAFSDEAVSKIFAAKSRPPDNPLIVHISQKEDLRRVAIGWPSTAEALINRFWPGPLTLVLQRRPDISSQVSAGLTTVAVRIPDHPVALTLLRAVGLPIAAPSANRSGRTSPTRPEHVMEDLEGHIAALLAAGPTKVGLESTVVDLSTSKPTILRPGAITREMLLPYLPNLHENEEEVDGQLTLHSPGMRYSHYAPKAPLYLYSGDSDAVWQRIVSDADMWRRTHRKVAVLFSEPLSQKHDKLLADLILDMAHLPGSQETDEVFAEERQSRIAANLFAILRHCDSEKIGIILVQGVDTPGLGEAIMNRLGKAARETIVV